MNIIKDTTMPDTFGKPPFRELSSVDEIVIHHTEGEGTWKGLLKWFLQANDKRKQMYEKYIALTHYYIQKDGKIIEAYPLDTWLYHSCSGKRDKTTVGIELFHLEGDFTDQQYASLFWLIFEYLPTICPNIKIVSSHDYRYKKYSNKTKQCPSRFFDWVRLKNANTKGWEVHAL